MKKRRLSLRLDQEEAAVVAPVEFWEQLYQHCQLSAKEFPEQREGWLDAADHIVHWMEKTRDRRT
jgi:hypothetical protein